MATVAIIELIMTIRTKLNVIWTILCETMINKYSNII
jgi:Flp pilus assembly pilin Flp